VDGVGKQRGNLLIHDVFGVVHHFEDLAGRFAREGYLTLVPELYSHDPVRKTLSDKDIEQAIPIRNSITRDNENRQIAIGRLPIDRREAMTKTLDWLMTRDSSTCFPDIKVSLAHLQARSDVDAPAIAVIGYCRGGTMAGALAASGAVLAATIVYYGLPPPLDDVPKIRSPILGHYGGDDPSITSGVPAFADAMRAHKKDFTHFIYAGARHAFFSDDRPNYHPEAARLSWARSLEFLDAHLKTTSR
jgi:carboxymethylenebutenolidase